MRNLGLFGALQSRITKTLRVAILNVVIMLIKYYLHIK